MMFISVGTNYNYYFPFTFVFATSMNEARIGTAIYPEFPMFNHNRQRKYSSQF